MKQKKIIIYLYNRLYDPLIQSNIMLYINDLIHNENCPYKFAIITYEDPKFPITGNDKINHDIFLMNNNIEWHPLKWHQGTSLFYKFLDIVNGFLISFFLFFKGYRYIVSLASVAGAYAYLYSLVFRFKLYLYQYEPHSDFMADNNTWSKSSSQYKILKYLEKKSALFAKVISSGTCYMEDRLKKWGTKALFYKIPSVVDSENFNFSETARLEIRKKYSINIFQNVFVYPGKIGDVYCSIQQFAEVIASINQLIENSFFIIITSYDSLKIKNIFKEFKILESNYIIIDPIPLSEMKKYLSAADFGLIFIDNTDSQIFRSPIKTGEYLCSGLPYIVPKNISEDDLFATKYNVGVVIEKLDNLSIQKSSSKIIELLNENKNELRIRCRKIGIDYRGFENLNIKFREALKNLTT